MMLINEKRFSVQKSLSYQGIKVWNEGGYFDVGG